MSGLVPCRVCAYKSFKRAVSFSATPRELTNTNVVRCARISSKILRSTTGQMEPEVRSPAAPTNAEESNSSLASESSPEVEETSLSSTGTMPLRSASRCMAGVTPLICGADRSASTPPTRCLAFTDCKSRMFSNGSIMRKSIAGRPPGFTMVTGCPPPRNRAASSGGFTVADRPMRCI